jgi:hypothetical protein
VDLVSNCCLILSRRPNLGEVVVVVGPAVVGTEVFGAAGAFTSGTGVISLRTGASDGGDAISVVSLVVEDFSGFAFLPVQV